MKKRILTFVLIASMILLMFSLFACSNGSRCGNGHDWIEIEVIEQADCLNPGMIYGRCSVCGIRRRVAIDPLGHDIALVPGTAIAPTCTENGYEGEFECVRDGCDYTKSGAVIPALTHKDDDGDGNCDNCGGDPCNHVWGDWADNGDGTHTRVCTLDGTHTETADHNLTESTTVEPTCEGVGELTITCSDCGYTYTDEIDALGHAYPDNWTNTGEGHCEKVCGNDSDHVLTHICNPETDDADVNNICDVCGFNICDVIGHIDTDEWHDYRCDRPVNLNGDTCGLSTCVEHQLAPAGPGTHIPGTLTDGHRCANCGDMVAISDCNIEYIVIQPSCTKYGYYGNVCKSDSMWTLLDEGGLIDPLGHGDYDGDGLCDRCGEGKDTIVNCDHQFVYKNDSGDYGSSFLSSDGYEHAEFIDFHWQECELCGYIGGFEEHDYCLTVTKAPTYTENGYDTIVCKCGKERGILEDRTNFVPSTSGCIDTNGDYECDNCGGWVGHICYDVDNNCECDECYNTVHNDGNDDHICDNCGQEHQVEKTYDDEFHYNYCYDCNEKFGHEAHEFGEIKHSSTCEGATTYRECDCGCREYNDYAWSNHIDEDGDMRCDRVLDNGEVCGASLCHSYDIYGDSSGCIDEDGDYLCDNCGHGVCECLYSGHEYDYKFDENNHWRYCLRCGETDTWVNSHDMYYSETDYGSEHFVLREYYECECGYGYVVTTYTNCSSTCVDNTENHTDTDLNNVCDLCETCLLENLQFVETVAPTCREDGYDVYICLTCNENVHLNYVYKTKHSFVFSEKRPSEWSPCEFYDIYVCEHCGLEKQFDIYAEHTYDEGTLSYPNCTHSEMVFTCTTCGNTSYEYVEGLAVGHNFVAVRTEPVSCDQYAYTVYECQNPRCGVTITKYDYSVEPYGHSVEIGAQIEATCTDPAHIIYQCSNGSCAWEKIVYDDEDFVYQDHVYGEPYYVEAAYCDEWSRWIYHCENCSYSYEDADWENPPTDHTRTEENCVYTPATCTEYGYWTYTCSVCHLEGIIETDNSVEPEHTFDENVAGTVILPGQCTDGYTIHVCTKCGEEVHTDIVRAEHPNKTYIWGFEPDCLCDGANEYYCPDCGEDVIIYIPATGHNMGEWISYDEYQHYRYCNNDYCNEEEYANHVDNDGDCLCDDCGNTYHTEGDSVYTDPTCTEYGGDGYYCVNCGTLARFIAYIEPLGHSHADDATPVAIVSPVSCIEPGYSTYVCGVCGVNYNTDYVQGDHVYNGGYSYRLEATCTNDGYDEFECGECGELYTVVIPALGHDVTWINQGCYHSAYCDNIGEEHIEPHVDENGDDVCDLCGGDSTVEHTVDHWVANYDDTHYGDCSVCGLQITENHSINDVDGSCDKCGVTPCSHDYHYTEEYDYIYHRIICSDCGQELGMDYHLDMDEDMICDYCWAALQHKTPNQIA